MAKGGKKRGAQVQGGGDGGAGAGESMPSHLVLTCMDFRHMDDLVDQLQATIPGTDAYDHLVVPGACLGVVQVEHPSWSPAFWSQVAVAHHLHGRTIKHVWLIEHMDCGAYKAFLNGGQALPDDREELLHRAMASLVAAGVTRWSREHTWDVAVETMIMKPTSSTSKTWTLHPLPPVGGPDVRLGARP